MRAIGRAAVLLLAGLPSVGCGDGEEPERVTVGAGAAEAGEVAEPWLAEVHRGNAAFRDGDHGEAMRRYRSATELAPEEPTAWFGVAMAAEALGDSAALRAAQQRLEALAPPAGAEAHPMPGEPPAAPGLPEGHPPIDRPVTPEY